MCGQLEESIGFNIKRREVAVWREEMAMQRHTDRNGKEPTTWKVMYNTAEGEVKGCKFGMRLPQVWILVLSLAM